MPSHQVRPHQESCSPSLAPPGTVVGGHGGSALLLTLVTGGTVGTGSEWGLGPVTLCGADPCPPGHREDAGVHLAFGPVAFPYFRSPSAVEPASCV